FEALVEDLIERTIEPCRIAIKDAGVKLSDVGDVILVGGMTRMPKVQEKVKEFFGKEPRKDVNPDEAVAVGAAIQAGVLQGDVKFDIDANGILHVNAKDKATGKENKITIKASSGLSETEIQKMVKDAEEHAEDDRKMLETVQARNHLDALVHSVQKSVTEYGDKIGADEKGKIEGASKEAEELLKDKD